MTTRNYCCDAFLCCRRRCLFLQLDDPILVCVFDLNRLCFKYPCVALRLPPFFPLCIVFQHPPSHEPD